VSERPRAALEFAVLVSGDFGRAAHVAAGAGEAVRLYGRSAVPAAHAGGPGGAAPLVCPRAACAALAAWASARWRDQHHRASQAPLSPRGGSANASGAGGHAHHRRPIPPHPGSGHARPDPLLGERKSRGRRSAVAWTGASSPVARSITPHPAGNAAAHRAHRVPHRTHTGSGLKSARLCPLSDLARVRRSGRYPRAAPPTAARSCRTARQQGQRADRLIRQQAGAGLEVAGPGIVP
jgi:hypothetical protein